MNKTIAKNTLLLYFRMLLTMAVSLYTVRIVLITLGTVDYGIYNVVGGIVVAFAFFTVTMTTASQRFFAFEIGRGNMEQLKRTFSMTLILYGIMAIVMLVLAETLGLWFLNHKMYIPTDRMIAANWIYQFSIFTFMLTMFQVPYDAIVIAHERMNVYAYLSILEAILKLLIVYLLVILPYDKLIAYGILIFIVTLIITSTYRTYCIRNFKECKFEYYWNKEMFKELTYYSGWNLFGALGGMLNNQGFNILLNLFFGPTVNAARGIAFQINASINSFVQNFIIASRPQITKYYANGEKQQMLKLVFQSSKFSFLLLFILTMPVLLETQFILSIWLKKVPEYVVLFTQLIIVAAMIDSLSFSLQAAAQATGKIKKYQIIVGGVMLLNVPVSYIFLKLGYPSQIVFNIAIVNTVVCLFLRLLLLSKMVDLSISRYIHEILWPISLISVVSYILPLFIIHEMSEGGIRFFTVVLGGFFSSVIVIYVIGLSKNEKSYLTQVIRNFKLKEL